MKKLLSLTLLAAATLTVSAQGTVQDYKNAFAIRGKYSNKMTNGNVSAHRRGESNFWYSVFNGDETLYYEVNAKTGEKTIIEDPTPRHRPERRDGTQHHWMEVLDEKDGRAENPANGRQRIIHKNNNLYLMEEGTSETSTQITTDGVDTCYYSSWGRWSKDGKYYATVKIKPAPKHYVTYTLSSPTSQVQPIYSNQEYAKPGDSLNYRIPVIVDVENCKVIEPKSTALFASQYDVSAPVWDEDFKSVTFEFNERGHKTFRVLEMNLMGDVKTIIEEKNDKYVAYSRNLRRDLGNGKILWKSDRDGHAHLYLYDRKTGKHTQITKGDFWVRDVQHYSIDEKGKGYIIFSANGMNCKNMGIVTSSFDGEIKEEDPYNVHYYRIDINGKNLVCLTPERGNHSATLNGDQTALIDTYSSIDKAPITVLRSATDGKIITTLETADIAKLESNGWKAPEVFVAPGRDGKTDMWGIIQRPTNFDPNKKYPVIEYIYSGPGDQYVPKSFTPWLWNLADLAELGFIVVQLDAMTTSFRSLDLDRKSVV